MPEDALLIDALGLRCPEPLLKLRSALREQPDRRHFVVLADDPLAHVDLGAFCARFGHDLQRDNSGTRYVITRAGS
ncbi:sulfurtransferase TusA family protein [Ahniella affigens]|uniref:Sulfurtransferase TusA family protein n=1 Tax=Ahniella affigens TaxID=2021234 RepID=A0A2P1PLM9_9GAMM|nr:sulfurtransferase TusA family protein [Ahniella affigens]AVP95749.1 sulfurtransferase TusA family protein [Ahniella affigens]